MLTKMRAQWVGMLAAGVLTATASAAETAVLKTQKDRTSYSLGVDMARNFKRQGIEVELGVLLKGFQDGLSGEKLVIPERELRQHLITIQNEVRQKHSQLRGRSLSEINKKTGEAFLAGNKTKEGVVALPSGLQYRILKAGIGRKPTDADTVQCNYRGTHLDGTEFICSNPGQPATFKVKEADMPGWAEALKLMPVGSKWRLFMPTRLAYGEQGVGRDLGPNETVICDLELAGIK
jgi:FKBP-type peptidyl-prolyl cis-trans isomerase